MILLKNFSKTFASLGQLMAFLTILLLGIVYLNDVLPVHFLSADLYNTLVGIKDYAVILTITVCGFSLACKTSLIIFIPFCLLAVCALACYSIIIFG